MARALSSASQTVPIDSVLSPSGRSGHSVSKTLHHVGSAHYRAIQRRMSVVLLGTIARPARMFTHFGGGGGGGGGGGRYAGPGSPYRRVWTSGSSHNHHGPGEGPDTSRRRQ